MKKYIPALLLSVFLLFAAPSAFADGTTLTTSVPSVHIIHIDAGSGGSVNGLRGEAELRSDRFSRVVLEIKPDSGYELRSALYNGVDVTAELINGCYVIDSVNEDGSFAVTFRRSPGGRPQTGDGTQLPLWTLLLLASGAGIYMTQRCTHRRT